MQTLGASTGDPNSLLGLEFSSPLTASYSKPKEVTYTVESGLFVTFSWPRRYLLSLPCILLRFIRHTGIYVTSHLQIH